MGITNYKRSTLRGRDSFRHVFEYGHRVHGNALSLLILNQEGPLRIAVCVSRKVDCAVKRNRLKRVCKEIVEPFINALPDHKRVILLPRKHFDQFDFAAKQKILNDLFRKSGLIDRNIYGK